MRLSAIERKILNCIQEDIPLIPEPFELLSKRLGLREGEFLNRIKGLRERGIIRNYAAGINHKRLGFTSSLIALRIPSNELDPIVKEIVSYKEVTHCFLRDGEYNLWIVFICLRKKLLREFLNKLIKKIGKKNILNIPTKRQFKLKTKLKI